MMMQIRPTWYPALIMIAATLLFWPHTVHAGFWPGGPLCIVAFDDFARFAQLWRDSGIGLPTEHGQNRQEKNGENCAKVVKKLAEICQNARFLGKNEQKFTAFAF